MTILGRIPHVLVMASVLNAQLPLASLASAGEGSVMRPGVNAAREMTRERIDPMHQFEGADGSVVARASSSDAFSRGPVRLEGEVTRSSVDSTSAANPAPPALHQMSGSTSSDASMSAKKPLTSQWWFWTGAGVVAGGVVYALSKRGGGDDGGGGGHGNDPLPYFPNPPQ